MVHSAAGNNAPFNRGRTYVNGIRFCFPFCVELPGSHVGIADLRNRRTQKAAVLIPALKNIACTGHVLCCRQGRTYTVDVTGHILPVGNGTAVCVQRNCVSQCRPLRRQGSYAAGNLRAGDVRCSVTAQPPKISIGIPCRPGQAVTSGGGEVLAVFRHNIHRAGGTANGSAVQSDFYGF